MIELNNAEVILRKSRANRIMPFEGVGGQLFLTDQRLFFKPHFINIQTDEKSIYLEDIDRVERKYSDFISGKMTIFLKNGDNERFYVPKRKKWVDQIIAAKSQREGVGPSL